LEESDDYYLRPEQGLRFLLFRNFFSSFHFDYGYNSSPVPGNRKYDIAYIFSLGYEFEF
jgi:hypothetical protein